MTDTTITTAHPLPAGAMVALDGEDLLRVISTTGAGPYTSILRRIPKWRIRLSHAWYRLRNWAVRPWHWWRATRCEPDEPGERCWRKATQGDYCDQHALMADEWGYES